MDATTAAAYLSMSEISLRHLTRRRGIAPVDFGGLALLRWRKIDLDALVEALPPRIDTHAAGGGTITPLVTADDLGAAAVERARRRARR